MRRLLLCCVDADENRVALLGQTLRKADIEVSLFCESSRRNKNSREDLLHQLIRTNSVVVVCWSKASVNCGWLKRAARRSRRLKRYLSLKLDRVMLGWWMRSPFNAAVAGWPARSADKGVEELLKVIDEVEQGKAQSSVYFPLGLKTFSIIATTLAGLMLSGYYLSQQAPAPEHSTELPAEPSPGLGLQTDAQFQSAAENERSNITAPEVETSVRDHSAISDLSAEQLGRLSISQLDAAIRGDAAKTEQAERNARSALAINPAQPQALLTLGVIELFRYQRSDTGRSLIDRYFMSAPVRQSSPEETTRRIVDAVAGFDTGAGVPQKTRISATKPAISRQKNVQLTALCRTLDEGNRQQAAELIAHLNGNDRLQLLSDSCLLSLLNRRENHPFKRAIVIPGSAPDND